MLKQTQSSPAHWNIARVLQETTLSKSTLYRLIQDGKGPKPIRISSRRVVWRESDIRAFLAGGV
jgi:prophage regulatory protein